jgi:hypothetical protein
MTSRPEARTPLLPVVGWALVAVPAVQVAQALFGSPGVFNRAVNILPLLPLLAAGVFLIQGRAWARRFALGALALASVYSVIGYIFTREAAAGELWRALACNALGFGLVYLAFLSPRSRERRTRVPITFRPKGAASPVRGRIVSLGMGSMSVLWDSVPTPETGPSRDQRRLEVLVAPDRWVRCRWSRRDSAGVDRYLFGG